MHVPQLLTRAASHGAKPRGCDILPEQRYSSTYLFIRTLQTERGIGLNNYYDMRIFGTEDLQRERHVELLNHSTG
jgi:hypothetical protein